MYKALRKLLVTLYCLRLCNNLPEVLNEVRADVNLAGGGPISRRVDDHPRLGPQKLVRHPEAYLLKYK